MAEAGSDFKRGEILSGLASIGMAIPHAVGRTAGYGANMVFRGAQYSLDCLSLFVKNRYRPVPLPPRPSFESWCVSTFGEGISRHFLFPYNRKLWKEPLSKLTADWQGRFMPRPTAEEVLYGALRDQKKLSESCGRSELFPGICPFPRLQIQSCRIRVLRV